MYGLYGYYFQDYISYIIIIAVCTLLAAIASGIVRKTFNKYDKIRSRSGYTGYDTAVRLMSSNGVRGISVGRVQGQLSDHYHPAKSIVNLSESTYGSNSVAAVAVAAHEIGHVMQKQNGYWFYNLRTALVPVVNIGSRLAMPLVLLGLVLDYLSLTANSEIGFYIALIGVALYGGSFVFALVTLPVELNASRRACEMLEDCGILTADEIPSARKVLSAAAFTYLVSLVTSFIYFLRFLLRVLVLFGRRSRR